MVPYVIYKYKNKSFQMEWYERTVASICQLILQQSAEDTALSVKKHQMMESIKIQIYFPYCIKALLIFFFSNLVKTVGLIHLIV